MKNINKPKKTYQRKNSVSSFSSKMKLKMKDLNTNQIKENNTINKINAKEEDNKKFIKKHTWVYDQLFVKNNIVDESFESEKEEEEITPVKSQLLFNKYNILSEEIYQLKKEKNILQKVIKNNGKENKELEENYNNDIKDNKINIEKLLRLMAQFTKDILELKKQINDAMKKNE